jgi:hypothetical protein
MRITSSVGKIAGTSCKIDLLNKTPRNNAVLCMALASAGCAFQREKNPASEVVVLRVGLCNWPDRSFGLLRPLLVLERLMYFYKGIQGFVLIWVLRCFVLPTRVQLF